MFADQLERTVCGSWSSHPVWGAVFTTDLTRSGFAIACSLRATLPHASGVLIRSPEAVLLIPEKRAVPSIATRCVA